MSLIRVNPRFCTNLVPLIRNGARSYAVAATKEEEYSAAPEYPSILDVSYKAKVERAKQEWHEKIKSLNTVEEKLFALNMPRYYGWRSLILQEGVIPYDAVPLAQYITRTHIVKESGLPKYYDRLIPSEKLDAAVQDIKKQIEDVVTFEYTSRMREQELNDEDAADPKKLDNIIAEAVVKQINRILLANLSPKLPHILETQIDFEPRVEAFWFTGGIEPPANARKSREGVSWLKEFANDPIDRCVQYTGEPILQLRHDLPLKEIVSLSESENAAFEIPPFKFDPRVLGCTFQYRHGTTVPGFWPGDPSEFGLLSYHNRGHLLDRPVEFKDESDALSVQAIFASYGWLLSQACYQGFSTFNDLTYPLTTQTIITNGQHWSFYVYQLNTTLLHSKYADENTRRNLCWVTDSMKLFEKIEDGKLHGFNEEVLKHLIKFYVNNPQKREGVDLKPYLGESEKIVSDIKDPERREWLDTKYKHLVANRPRHRLAPEIYAWQKIYLIDHKTRPLDKKREPFEFGINPMRRRLDEHQPVYIPKVLRPEGPKSRNKWRKTYYP